MAEHRVSDVPGNWRVLSSQTLAVPDISTLTQYRLDRDEGWHDATVMVSMWPVPDIRPTREWLADNEVPYRIYIRWKWTRSEVMLAGAVFRFETDEDAALFRLSCIGDGGLISDAAALAA